MAGCLEWRMPGCLFVNQQEEISIMRMALEMERSEVMTNQWGGRMSHALIDLMMCPACPYFK